MTSGFALLVFIAATLLYRFDAAWHQYLALVVVALFDWYLVGAQLERRERADRQLREDLAHEFTRIRESIAELESQVEELD